MTVAGAVIDCCYYSIGQYTKKAALKPFLLYNIMAV